MNKVIAIIAAAQILIVLLGWGVCHALQRAMFPGIPAGRLIYGYLLVLIPVAWFVLECYVRSRSNIPAWLEDALFILGCVIGILLLCHVSFTAYRILEHLGAEM